jgi:hypothetical protein
MTLKERGSRIAFNMDVMAVSPSITKTVEVKFVLLDIPDTSLLYKPCIKNQ